MKFSQTTSRATIAITGNDACASVTTTTWPAVRREAAARQEAEALRRGAMQQPAGAVEDGRMKWLRDKR